MHGKNISIKKIKNVYILWNPKFHHRIQKSPPLVPVVIEIDPVHVPLILFREGTFYYYSLVYVWVFQEVLYLAPPPLHM